MTTQSARSRQQVDDELSELTKLTISMQKGVLNELKQRARRRGMTVTELIRRAVVLEKMLFDDHPEKEVLLRDKETGEEFAIRML